jgi:hypothetical protein
MQEVVTSLQQRLPEAERKIKSADGKVDGRNIFKADLASSSANHTIPQECAASFEEYDQETRAGYDVRELCQCICGLAPWSRREN